MSLISFPALAVSPSDLKQLVASGLLPSVRLKNTREQFSASIGLKSLSFPMLENLIFTNSLGLGLAGHKSSVAAFPAKISAWLEEEPELPGVGAACGSNTGVSSKRSSRVGRSSKTSQPFALEDWQKFSGHSLRSGMMRNGIVSPLPPLALATGEIASGLWRTPGSTDADGRGEYATYESYKKGRIDKGKQISLTNQVKFKQLWPTSDASVAQDGEGPKTWLARRERVKKTAKNGNGMGMPLTIAVQLFPTPTARDYRSGMSKEAVARREEESSRGVNLSEHLQRLEGNNGKLNPTWVEWLMGYPLEWTALRPSETPLSRKSRKSSAKQS
jgi:hypothetical protein